MPQVDEVDAQIALYQAALRAKAKEPLTVVKFVNNDRLTQDPSGRIMNAELLVEEVREARPEIFEAPVVIKREPTKVEEPLTIDASEMTKAQFDAEFSRRFPRVVVAPGGNL